MKFYKKKKKWKKNNAHNFLRFYRSPFVFLCYNFELPSFRTFPAIFIEYQICAVSVCVFVCIFNFVFFLCFSMNNFLTQMKALTQCNSFRAGKFTSVRGENIHGYGCFIEMEWISVHIVYHAIVSVLFFSFVRQTKNFIHAISTEYIYPTKPKIPTQLWNIISFMWRIYKIWFYEWIFVPVFFFLWKRIKYRFDLYFGKCPCLFTIF